MVYDLFEGSVNFKVKPGKIMRIAYILLIFNSFTSFSQEQVIDSLRQLLSQDIPDTSRIEVFKEMSKIYGYMNADSGIYYAVKANEIAVRIRDTMEIARTINYESIAHWIKGDYDTAIALNKQALSYFLVLNDSNGIASCYTNQGILYDNQGKHLLALENYIESSKYFVAGSEYENMDWMSLYVNMGAVYQRTRLYEEALDQYYKALQYKDIFPVWVNTVYANICQSYFVLDEYDSVRKYIEIMETNAIRDDLVDYKAESSYYKGLLARVSGDYSQALFFMNNALSMYHQQRSSRDINLAHQELSGIHLALGDYSLALQFADSVLAYGRANSIKSTIAEGRKLRADALEKSGKIRDALYEYRLYMAEADTVLRQKSDTRLSEMKEKFEADQREKEINENKIALARNEATIARKNGERNLLLSGLLIAFLAAGFIYRNERIKTRKNKKIEALLREIHHRVKNNLQVISSLLNMQSRQLEDENVLEAIREGQSRVKAMSLIHQKLYQRDDITRVDFNDYTQNLLDQLDYLYSEDGKKIEKQVNAKGIQLDIDTAIPLGLILNELISNAYKYAFKEASAGKICVDLVKNENAYELKIMDNGKGLPSELDIAKSTTLGLRLVNMLVKQLKGQMTYSNSDGSVFSIRFNEMKIA